MTQTTSSSARTRIRELLFYFLRLGLIGFGGPVALVGQMERELVSERAWLTKEQMREAIAICQSLPGPLAIQVGIYISYLRGGFWGAWAGGWAFIFPNFVIVAALGALYVHFGDLKPVTAIFYGVSPAVIALILHSCYRLAKLGMEDRLQWAHCRRLLCRHRRVCRPKLRCCSLAPVSSAFCTTATCSAGHLPPRLQSRPSPALAQVAPACFGRDAAGKLLLFFLKAGSLTFGSGLVIVPFLEQGLVQQYGWLDQRQFLIAVAIGMISPGPVVITATFVGYLVAGFWGSLVSTIGIFLPSFILVLVAAPLLARTSRQSERSGLRERRLRGGDRHDPRRLHPARPHRHRRLADRTDWHRVACRSVPMEGEQSAAHRSDGVDRSDRLSAAATRVGDVEMTRRHEVVNAPPTRRSSGGLV